MRALLTVASSGVLSLPSFIIFGCFQGLLSAPGDLLTRLDALSTRRNLCGSGRWRQRRIRTQRPSLFTGADNPKGELSRDAKVVTCR